MFYEGEMGSAILLLGNLLLAGALFLWIWFKRAKFPHGLKAPLTCIMESAIYAAGLLRLTKMIMDGIRRTRLPDRSLWVAGFVFCEGMLWLFFFWRAMALASKGAEHAPAKYGNIRHGAKEYNGIMEQGISEGNVWEEWEYDIILILLLVSVLSGEGGASGLWAQFAGTFLSLGLFALLLYVRSRRYKGEQETTDKEDLSLRRQEEYQQSVELQYQRTRELWHDLKNHIHVLELLAGEERLAELNDYLGSFKRDVEIRMIPMKTGCTAVDALLSDKLYHARRKDMEILLQVCDLSKIMVRPSDLCAVLGNLLDNAMEACARLSENKKIQLRIKNQENFYYITVINTAADPAGEGRTTGRAKSEAGSGICSPGNDIPAAEKKRKENVVGHGLGLRSVERIAHQYGGSLVTDYEDGEFRAIVRMEG